MTSEFKAGFLTLSHVQKGGGYGENSDHVAIRLSDEMSSSRTISIEISHEQLGLLLVGQRIQVEYRPTNLDLIGKVLDSKEEFVPNESGLSADDRLKDFEVDGWVGQRADLENNHRGGSKGHTVRFTRYVEPTENCCTAHCCLQCGCKYGKSDCVVTNRKAPQEHRHGPVPAGRCFDY